MKIFLLAFLAWGQTVEVLKRLPELELGMDEGKLIFGGGALVRERGKRSVHYGSFEERDLRDYLEDAVKKGFISADRDQRVHTELASRLMREAEKTASRLAMLDAAKEKAQELLKKRKSVEVSGALDRLQLERQSEAARCKRLARRRELSGVLTCGR